jgi:hypothetical protein
MKRLFVSALCSLATLAMFSSSAVAADASADSAVLLQDIAASKDRRIAAALAKIDGTDRRLLALRAYLRAGAGLAERWSWNERQIAAFTQSAENIALQKEIEGVRQSFAAANPGFELWINPQVRSIDQQLNNWNSNASVGRAAAGLLTSFRDWQTSVAVTALPAGDLTKAAEKFLTGSVPRPIPTARCALWTFRFRRMARPWQARSALPPQRPGMQRAGPTSSRPPCMQAARISPGLWNLHANPGTTPTRPDLLSHKVRSSV